MKPEIKKLLILNLPYLLFVWLFDKAGAAMAGGGVALIGMTLVPLLSGLFG